MSWRNNLREASFRGAKFHIEESTTEVGRRNKVHEYPFSEVPYLEDLGKSAGVYQVIGYVIQNRSNGWNYMPERDALKKALEQEGPGTLVHPFLGSMQVGVLGKARIEEHVQGGGMARFVMTFVDSGKQQQASAMGGGSFIKYNQTAFADNVADDMQSVSKTQFTERYNTNGPGFLTDAQGAYGKVMSFFQKIHSTLLGVQATTVGIISKAQTAIRVVQNEIDFVLRFPDQLADAVHNTLGTYKKITPGSKGSYYDTSSTGSVRYTTSGGVSSAEQTQQRNYIKPGSTNILGSGITRQDTTTTTNAMRTYSNATIVDAALKFKTYGEDFEAFDATTPEREQQLKNEYAIINLVRVGAIAEAIRAAIYIEYNSYDDAIAMLNKLILTIDYVIESMGNYPAIAQDDVLFDLLHDAKPFVVIMMIAKGASLPMMVDYQLGADIMPSLMIAYRLYDDIEREQEIIDNNLTYMEHPGFPMGGSVLKVLSE